MDFFGVFKDSGIKPTTSTLAVRRSNPKRINTYRALAYRSSLPKCYPFPNEFLSCEPHTSESMDHFYGNRCVYTAAADVAHSISQPLRRGLLTPLVLIVHCLH